jgi:hypothetical protein
MIVPMSVTDTPQKDLKASQQIVGDPRLLEKRAHENEHRDRDQDLILRHAAPDAWQESQELNDVEYLEKIADEPKR